MGKLKRLSTEIVSLLFLESLSYNQILREIKDEKKEDIIGTIDILVSDGILNKRGSYYEITQKATDIFSCWNVEQKNERIRY